MIVIRSLDRQPLWPSLSGNQYGTPLSCSSMSLVRLILSFFLLYPCASFVHGSQTFRPAAVPFAVRTPSLNTWQNPWTLNGSTNNWPFFWQHGVSGPGVCVPLISQRPVSHTMCIQGLGWICYIRVDGTAYTLWGQNDPAQDKGVMQGNLISTEVTPTRTIQIINTGPLNVTVTFLSPVEVARFYPLQVCHCGVLIALVAIRLITAITSIFLRCTRI